MEKKVHPLNESLLENLTLEDEDDTHILPM